jgi:hypothetical protein
VNRRFCVAMLALAVICIFGGAARSAGNSLVLADGGKGKTAYSIAIPDSATVPEINAAGELSSYIKKMTGVDMPVVAESAIAPSMPAIFVGWTKKAAALNPDKMKSDGIIVKTDGQNLILSGGRPRGTVYAVTYFLEEICGVRWWTPTEEDVPNKAKLVIPPVSVSYNPPFEIRCVSYMDLRDYGYWNPVTRVANGAASPENKTFARHLYINTNVSIPAEWGGTESIFRLVHSTYMFLPPSKYFAAHPDWYALVKGKRVANIHDAQYAADSAQLCYTNPEMRKELIRVVLESLHDHPEVAGVGIGATDASGWCQCPTCSALVAKEGSQAGPVLDCVNAVAAVVKKEFPSKVVVAMAYQDTATLPSTIRPDDNVVICYAPDQRDVFRPIQDTRFNKKEMTDLTNWSKVSSGMYVWDYVTNFAHYMYPQPNLLHIDQDVRFYQANKVKYLKLQGDSFCKTGDLIELRTWVLPHLVWNPSLNGKKLVKEFCDGYYGPAGKYIYQWIDLMCAAGSKAPARQKLFSHDLTWLTLDTMNKGSDLWTQAGKSVAGNEKFAKRVARARLSFDFAWIEQGSVLEEEAQKTGKVCKGPDSYVAATGKLFKAMDDAGTTLLQEAGNVKSFTDAKGALRLKAVMADYAKLK